MTSPSRSALLLLATLALAACNDDDDATTNPPIIQPPDPHAALSNIDTTGGAEGIVELPTSVPTVVRNVFARYSQLTMPNGKRVHVLAQSGVSDELHVRVRRVLDQHLTSLPGSTFGADKTALRNALGDGKATFALFRDAASADPTSAEVTAFATAFEGYGQLIAADSIVEGAPEYLQASPALDTTLSTTARFILRAGGAEAATYRDAIAVRAAAAEAASLYTPAPSPQDAAGDFLARTLEVYYGVWGHDPLGNGRAGVADVYAFSERLTMEVGDPQTLNLIEGFFPSFHTYAAFLIDGFAGTFETDFDPALPYTHRSRYLSRVGLRGAVSARINGNDYGGRYRGAEGDLTVYGAGGDDVIEGGSLGGNDIAIYSGPSTDYLITPSPLGGGATQVLDTVQNRDGVDQLRFIERLQFSDTTIDL